jgi:hypothetical protein
MWIVFLILVVILGAAFVGLFLYGVIGTTSWLWQIGAAITETFRTDKSARPSERALNTIRTLTIDADTREREDTHRQQLHAMADQYVVEKREQDRLETLTLTHRYVAHVLISSGHVDATNLTLETVRRAYRTPRTIGELNSFAQLVHLDEFTRVLLPYDEGSVWARGAALRIAEIGQFLDELIRLHGSAMPVTEVPEFANLVPGLDTRNP